jgi:hypothetical protein
MAKDDVDSGESEENVYSDEVREDLVDSGEISPEEEGFMMGYDEADEDKDEDDEDKKKKSEDEDED